MSQGCLEERAQPLLRRSLQAASLRPRPAVLLTEKGPQGLAGGIWTARLGPGFCPAQSQSRCVTWVGGRGAVLSLLCTSVCLVVHRGACRWCVRTCAPSQALSRAVCSRGPSEVVSWASPCRERTPGSGVLV